MFLLYITLSLPQSWNQLHSQGLLVLRSEFSVRSLLVRCHCSQLSQHRKLESVSIFMLFLYLFEYIYIIYIYIYIYIYIHIHTQIFMSSYVCVLSCFSHVWLFVTPWTVTHQTPVHGILQARILEWVAMSSSRGSSHPGIEPVSLMSPALAGRFFTTSTTWNTSNFQTALQSTLSFFFFSPIYFY